jgi:hypothetical protein
MRGNITEMVAYQHPDMYVAFSFCKFIWVHQIYSVAAWRISLDVLLHFCGVRSRWVFRIRWVAASASPRHLLALRLPAEQYGMAQDRHMLACTASLL